MVMHVDDVVCVGNDWFFDNVWKQIMETFHLTEDDDIKDGFVYCGKFIQEQADGSICISMCDYVESLRKMPVPNGRDEDELDQRHHHFYWKLVGKLNWLQSSKARPDGRFGTLLASQAQQKPTIGDARSANKVVEELQHARDLKITIPVLRGRLRVTGVCD